MSAMVVSLSCCGLFLGPPVLDAEDAEEIFDDDAQIVVLHGVEQAGHLIGPDVVELGRDADRVEDEFDVVVAQIDVAWDLWRRAGHGLTGLVLTADSNASSAARYAVVAMRVRKGESLPSS